MYTLKVFFCSIIFSTSTEPLMLTPVGSPCQGYFYSKCDVKFRLIELMFFLMFQGVLCTISFPVAVVFQLWNGYIWTPMTGAGNVYITIRAFSRRFYPKRLKSVNTHCGGTCDVWPAGGVWAGWESTGLAGGIGPECEQVSTLRPIRECLYLCACFCLVIRWGIQEGLAAERRSRSPTEITLSRL